MASFKSRFVIGLMRRRHLLKGRFRKETMGRDIDSVLKFRQACERGAERFGKVPEGVRVKPEVTNMIISEWLIPEGASPGKLIFYVHGGGYVSGSCNDHRVLLSKVALGTGVTVFHFEYGLAPESPFPAALNDSISAWEGVLEKGYHPESIIMMGESAGGGLTLALLLALRDKKMPLPKAAVAISPWTDLSCTNKSYTTRNKGSLAPLDSWNVFSHYYVGENDVSNPYISPLNGDLRNLPPVYINAGNSDELFDDGKLFYEKAKEAGSDIQFFEGEGMIHCYPLLAPMFPEATLAMDQITGYILNHLNQHE